MKIKDYRRVAMRFEKTGRTLSCYGSFGVLLCLACIITVYLLL